MAKEIHVTLPESEEDLGKYLERTNGRMEVICVLGVYRVQITYCSQAFYRESDLSDVSVRKHQNMEITGHGRTFSIALRAALSVKP